MDAYIVTDSSHYIPRAYIAGDCLKEKGFNVGYIFSDFNHFLKKKVRTDGPGITYIDAGAYKKNISPARLLYHHSFAKKAYAYLEDKNIDLLYVFLPGNSLAPESVKLKSKKKCRLIFDIIDLWPESLPVKGIEWTPPVRYWRKLRDRNLDSADMLLTECSLYIDKLGLDRDKSHTMYWTKTEDVHPVHRVKSGAFCPDAAGVIKIAYLGSINNIIDIPGITGLLVRLAAIRPAELHIIGDGENRDTFLSELDHAGIAYTYYGTVYDEEEKEKILRQCTWGINIMKQGVMVGLTMKSIDYMANGLLLINNIPGDTSAIVEEYGFGVNVGTDLKDAAEKISGYDGYDASGIYKFYENNFTVRAARELLDDIL